MPRSTEQSPKTEPPPVRGAESAERSEPSAPRSSDGTDRNPEQVAPWIQDAGRELPIRNDKGPTTGRMFERDGTMVTQEPFTTGDGRLRSGVVRECRDTLEPDWHPRDQATWEHAEGHAAAYLRQDGSPDHVDVVINNEPCRSNGPYAGCEELLRDEIPQDKSMTVYVTDGENTRLHDTYHGTGRGVLG